MEISAKIHYHVLFETFYCIVCLFDSLLCGLFELHELPSVASVVLRPEFACLIPCQKTRKIMARLIRVNWNNQKQTTKKLWFDQSEAIGGNCNKQWIIGLSLPLQLHPIKEGCILHTICVTSSPRSKTNIISPKAIWMGAFRGTMGLDMFVAR